MATVNRYYPGAEDMSLMGKWRKKLVKLRDRTLDSLKAWLAGHQNLVTHQSLLIPPQGNRKDTLAIVAHFSPYPGVHSYVYGYLQALQEAGCDVMLVSTSERLPDPDLQQLQARGVSVIVRRNVGYDFGSWKTAVEVYPGMAADYRTIIFANDSVYGPLTDLAPLLSLMAAREYDVWGLTLSHERRPHLQTYFWAMSGAALNGGFFQYFWKQYYRFYSRRQTVIDRYELQIAAMAKARFGLSVGACWDAESFRLSDAGESVVPGKMNPMRDCWRSLLDQGFPFIKRELFKSIPPGTAAYQAIAEAVQSIDAEAWQMYESHLHELSRH